MCSNAGPEFRFPLDLRAIYRSLERRRPHAGQGWVDEYEQRRHPGSVTASNPAGTALELSIEWPYLLDGRIPLQLMAVGKVVRREKSSFALQLTAHEFRTARKSSFEGKPLALTSVAGGM